MVSGPSRSVFPSLHPGRGTRIRLADCAKTFPDGTRALLPLTLEIEPQEKIVILGPSGCGENDAFAHHCRARNAGFGRLCLLRR